MRTTGRHDVSLLACVFVLAIDLRAASRTLHHANRAEGTDHKGTPSSNRLVCGPRALLVLDVCRWALLPGSRAHFLVDVACRRAKERVVAIERLDVAESAPELVLGRDHHAAPFELAVEL